MVIFSGVGLIGLPSDLTNKVQFLPLSIMLMFFWVVICLVHMKISIPIVMFVSGIHINHSSSMRLPMHDTADQLSDKLSV